MDVESYKCPKCFAGASPRDIVHFWRCQQDISSVPLFETTKKKKKSLLFLPCIDFLSAVTLVLLCFSSCSPGHSWDQAIIVLIKGAGVYARGHLIHIILMASADPQSLPCYRLSSPPCSWSCVLCWDLAVRVLAHAGPGGPSNLLAGSNELNGRG